MALQELDGGTGFLKAGFQGFQGSGKTFTAALLAMGIRKYQGMDGPVAMFDTESGSPYIREMIQKATGKKLLGQRSRSLDALLVFGEDCLKAGVSCAIVDSMTHIWRDVCDARLVGVNRMRDGRGMKPRTSLEFADWAPIKAAFARWTDFYLNSPLHIIICGRAGYEYDFEMNEETGKKDLVKTGIKMKTETEFGFEPSLLVEMEQERVVKDGDITKTIIRRATVLKDRFNVIDGKVFDNPTFESFLPHVALLTPGAHAPVDTTVATDLKVDDSGDTEWQAERKQRTILVEELEALLLQHYPSTGGNDRKAKSAVVKQVFQTGSWTKVQSLDSKALRAGLKQMQELLADKSKVDAMVAAETSGA